MKRALFIMKYLIGDSQDNLYTKISGQIKAVEELGYEVWLSFSLWICSISGLFIRFVI